MQNREEKLSDYGYSFQTKIVAAIMTDANFVSSVYDILELDFFNSESVKFLIDNGLNYFRQYKRLPTLDVYKVAIQSVNNELLKKEIITTLKESVKNVNSSDLELVKTSTVDFCKNQKVKEAILASVDDLQAGKYDSIRSRIDAALKVGISNDLGHNYTADLESRYTTSSRTVISTGWDVIDDITKGGFGNGELGVFIAPSGAGKSFILVHLGAAAIKAGKKVVHYTLELDAEAIGIRYDAMLSGISLTKLTSELAKDYIPDVETKIHKYNNSLYIKRYPTKGVSLMGIRAHLQKLAMFNFIPDLIIIDYADLLRYNIGRDMAKHDALEALYEELRGMAGEFNIPLITVSQSNRSAMENEIIEGGNISSAYSKIFPADFVASLSRKASDRLSNTGRMHIIKNRNGPDGITFPVHMDTAKAVIRVYDATTDSGQEVSGKMRTNQEYERARLKQRFTELSARETVLPKGNDEADDLF